MLRLRLFRNAISRCRLCSRVFNTGRDDGASVVEFALSACVLTTFMFGIMSVCLVIYSYFFVANAARLATRYAMVRGSASCTYSPNLTNCKVTNAEVKSYVQSLNYPGINTSNLNAITTWLSPSSTTPTTWSSCTVGTCNAPGYAVNVVVTYTTALQIPFVPNSNLSFSSTSQMVISQ